MNCASWQYFIRFEVHRDGDVYRLVIEIWNQTAAWMAFLTGGVRAIGREPGSDRNKLAEPVLSSEVLPRQHMYN